MLASELELLGIHRVRSGCPVDKGLDEVSPPTWRPILSKSLTGSIKVSNMSSAVSQELTS